MKFWPFNKKPHRADDGVSLTKGAESMFFDKAKSNTTTGKSQEPPPKPELFSAPNTPERRRAEQWLKAHLEKGRHTFHIETMVEITPVLAELMLTHNTGNRKLRPVRVARLARVIKRGGVVEKSLQGISFAADGTLNNGQHRLMAIIETGMAWTVTVAFGEDRRAFLVADTNGARTGADICKIEGYKNPAVMAGAVRMFRYIESGLSDKIVDNDEVVDLIDKYEGLEESAAAGQAAAAKLKSAPTAFAVAHYLISEKYPTHPKVDEFFKQLGDGLNIKSKRDPIYVMRRQVTQQRGMSGALNYKAELVAELIIAWNLWARGKKKSSIQWKKTDGDGFPEVE